MLTNIVNRELYGLNDPSIRRAILVSKLSRWHMSQTRSTPRAMVPFPKKSYTGYFTYNRTDDDKMLSSVSIIENPHFYYNNDVVALRDEAGNVKGYKEKNELCLELRLNNEVERRGSRPMIKSRFVYFGFRNNKLEFVVDKDSTENIRAVNPDKYLVELENNTIKIYKKLFLGSNVIRSNTPRYRIKLGTEKIPETLRKCLPDSIGSKLDEARSGSQPTYKEGSYCSWYHRPRRRLGDTGASHREGIFEKNLTQISHKIYDEIIKRRFGATELNETPLPKKIYIDYNLNKRTASLNIIYINKFTLSKNPKYGGKYHNSYGMLFKDSMRFVHPYELQPDTSEREILSIKKKHMKRFLLPYAHELKDLPQEVIGLFDPIMRNEIYKSMKR